MGRSAVSVRRCDMSKKTRDVGRPPVQSWLAAMVDNYKKQHPRTDRPISDKVALAALLLEVHGRKRLLRKNKNGALTDPHGAPMTLRARVDQLKPPHPTRAVRRSALY